MRHHTHYLRHITDWFEWLKNPKFGDIAGGNYAEFETDGTLRFHGDACVYDDLKVPALSAFGRGSPTQTDYKGGKVLTLASNIDQGIYFNVQVPHKYKLGGEMEIHAHIVVPTAGAGAGAENVKLDFTYSWAGIGDTFPTASTLTATRDVQNDAADTHIYMDIGDLVDPGIEQTLGVSSMIICSLTRDVSVANDYSSSVYLLEADFHFEIDTLGSREEYVK